MLKKSHPSVSRIRSLHSRLVSLACSSFLSLEVSLSFPASEFLFQAEKRDRKTKGIRIGCVCVLHACICEYTRNKKRKCMRTGQEIQKHRSVPGEDDVPSTNVSFYVAISLLSSPLLFFPSFHEGKRKEDASYDLFLALWKKDEKFKSSSFSTSIPFVLPASFLPTATARLP